MTDAIANGVTETAAAQTNANRADRVNPYRTACLQRVVGTRSATPASRKAAARRRQGGHMRQAFAWASTPARSQL